MRILITVSLFLCVSFASTVAQEQASIEKVFEQGNAAYAAHDYLGAIEAYQVALTQYGKTSPSLLYNMGSAYYHLGDFPSALLAYERALTLEPGNPDVLANLEKVLNNSNLFRPTLSLPQEFAYSLPVNVWLILIIIGSAFITLAGLLIKLAPKLSPFPNLVLYLSIPFLIVCAIALMLWKQDFNRALILLPETVIKVAPTESANVLDTVPNGTWVEVLETHAPFHYIRTESKQEGWVDDLSLGKVWPAE